MPRQQLDLNIVYEDDDLLVISKPAGLLVIPDRWDASKPTVVKLARAYLTRQAAAKGTIAAEPPRIWVVHRLDRDTSGVLILAKSDRVHAALSQQFERGTVMKTYLALINGQGIRAEGIIRLPIGPHPQRLGMMAIQYRQGKSAITRYAQLSAFVATRYSRCGHKPGAAIKFVCIYRRSAIRWPSIRSMALANRCCCQP